MDKLIYSCSYCAGLGYTIGETEIRDNGLYREHITCKHCKGTGELQFALFTMEEAKVIMEACGLQIVEKEKEEE